MRLTALSILLLCASFLANDYANAQTRWVPLGGIGRALMPGEAKNPRFKQGDTRINFYVEGNQLDSMINPELSTGCVLGEFNQIKKRRYFVNVRMPNDTIKRFGFANGYGYNLRDKNTLRIENEVYLFDLDGTSECRVYSILTPAGG